MQAIADIVLNHKAGGDELEKIKVVKVNPDNRNETMPGPFEIEAYTKFTFPGRKRESYNISKIFEDTLVKIHPEKTVIVVCNHDTQPLQALEAPVDAFIKPIAYSLILFRDQGYACIFYTGLYRAYY